MTGATERTLKRLGRPYRKVHIHPNGHASYYPGTHAMHLKVLFDPDDGRLLGAQAVGVDGVDKRIDVLAVALRAGLTIEDLEHLELAYAPPYGSAKDPVNMAGFVGGNLLRGDVALWYAEEWPDLPEGAVLLDVRSPEEHAEWAIPGSAAHPAQGAARAPLRDARQGCRCSRTAGPASAPTSPSGSSPRAAGQTPAPWPAASSRSAPSTPTAAPGPCLPSRHLRRGRPGPAPAAHRPVCAVGRPSAIARAGPEKRENGSRRRTKGAAVNTEQFQKMQSREGLHRGPRPERRQHPEGAAAVRPRRDRLLRRGRDVRPHPCHAHADHHQPGLHR